MYNGKYNAKVRKNRKVAMTTVIVSLILVLTLSVGGTIAYLTANTDTVVNEFTPSTVACEVTEEFDGTYKSNICVKNTGDTDVYVRLKLVCYRVNDEGERIGGEADYELPDDANLGDGWRPELLFDDYGFRTEYFYNTIPVKPGKSTAPLYTTGIILQEYEDADGGKLAIDVIAEAIQSEPASAVYDAWGIDMTKG